MKVAMACDHGGLDLKNTLKAELEAMGHEVVDYGCYTHDSVDYPDFAYKAAKAVATGECEKGVVVCGTGIGISISCNKVHGIRCALCHDVFSAKATRAHNDANMLAMGQRVIGPGLALEILHAFFEGEYEGGRHDLRIEKMMAIEKINRSSRMGVTIIEHPLIKEKMAVLRNELTTQRLFKDSLDEIVTLMAFEVTKDLELETYDVKTPLQVTTGHKLKKPVILVPILRAGLGFLDGMRKLMPDALVGHIGMARNEETLMPEEYYAKFPSCLPEATVIVLDPMLATGGSACDAIAALKQRGATDLRMVSLVGAPEGLEKLAKEHPDVPLYLAVLDEKLNENGYILPGLGDAGDRLFGTF